MDNISLLVCLPPGLSDEDVISMYRKKEVEVFKQIEREKKIRNVERLIFNKAVETINLQWAHNNRSNIRRQAAYYVDTNTRPRWMGEEL